MGQGVGGIINATRAKHRMYLFTLNNIDLFLLMILCVGQSDLASEPQTIFFILG